MFGSPTGISTYIRLRLVGLPCSESGWTKSEASTIETASNSHQSGHLTTRLAFTKGLSSVPGCFRGMTTRLDVPPKEQPSLSPESIESPTNSYSHIHTIDVGLSALCHVRPAGPTRICFPIAYRPAGLIKGDVAIRASYINTHSRRSLFFPKADPSWRRSPITPRFGFRIPGG